MIASTDVSMCKVVTGPPRGKKPTKREPVPNVDIIDMLKKLREDEHSAEKISEITRLPVHIVKQHW